MRPPACEYRPIAWSDDEWSDDEWYPVNWADVDWGDLDTATPKVLDVLDGKTVINRPGDQLWRLCAAPVP